MVAEGGRPTAYAGGADAPPAAHAAILPDDEDPPAGAHGPAPDVEDSPIFFLDPDRATTDPTHVFDRLHGLFRPRGIDLKSIWRAHGEVRHHRDMRRDAVSAQADVPGKPPSPAGDPPPDPDYADWIARNDTLTETDRAQIRGHAATFGSRPTFSIVMPVYDPRPEFLRAAIESVRAQLYENWELCVADDASPSAEIWAILQEFAVRDARIRATRRSVNGGRSACSNSALQLATGDWIVPIDHDDLIAEHALYLAAERLQHVPDAAILYSDEDRCDEEALRFGHYFKPDWDYDLFLGQNLIGHLGVFRADLVHRMGGFRDGYDGSQDWDLALRVLDAEPGARVEHIPFVLYHRRRFDNALCEPSTAGAADAAQRAVSDHFARTGQRASATLAGQSSHLRIKRELPARRPLVSIVIPTRDRANLLRTCIDGILDRTDYAPFEIVVVDNGSVDTDALDFLARIETRPGVSVLRDDGAFNFSRLVNRGVAASAGEICVLLNNDIDIINRDWLDEMVSHAVRPEVGVVGAKLYYPDGSLQHGGVVLGPDFQPLHVHRGLSGRSPGYGNRLNLTHNLSFVTGACFAVRRDFFEELGGFNESVLTVAFNDVDFCARARRADRAVIWTPGAELFHLESASRGFDTTPEKLERAEREREYVRREWEATSGADPFLNPNLAPVGSALALNDAPDIERPWRRWAGDTATNEQICGPAGAAGLPALSDPVAESPTQEPSVTDVPTQDAPRTAAPRHGVVRRLRELRRYVRATGLRSLIRHPRTGRRRYRDRNLLLSSGELDIDFYRRKYPDVAASGADVALHYLLHGAEEERDPSETFATAAYVAANPDVAAAGINPLIHYLRFGAGEGRDRRPDVAPDPAPSGPVGTPAERPCVFVAGESMDEPSFVYRIRHYADAMRRLGEPTIVLDRSGLGQHMDVVKTARILFISRANWAPDTAAAIALARRHGVPVVYDVDDLMFRPELASAEHVDAIRFNAYDPKRVAEHFESVRRVMREADMSAATTDELAWQMRTHNGRKPAFVLRNGFTEQGYLLARLGARRRAAGSDGLVRIGYAGGSRTHQADFRQCASAVAAILRANDTCRLVLFRRGGAVTLDPTEFPDLAGLENRIEWREFVSLDDLPTEMARFDINLAPLDHGNPFCEAKSELKYFEAAIADVPTVASPTGPMKWAIRHGQTGFLAADPAEWQAALTHLVESPSLRRTMAREAHRSVLWPFGPLRRSSALSALLDQLEGGPRAARAFRFEAEQAHTPPATVPLAERRILFETQGARPSRVTVIVPLHNYEHHIGEALDSVAAQTLPDLDLVVVDDRSTDDSQARARAWMERHRDRFNRVVLAGHIANQGLGSTRNTAMDLADTLHVLALDADNRLLPRCCERLLDAVDTHPVAFAYPTIQQFGDAHYRMGELEYHPAHLVAGNYIDAMAMISKEAWSLVGGYTPTRHGWEDFDLWCRFVEHGLPGVHVGETLAEYRVHEASMLRTSVDLTENKDRLVAHAEAEHPWLSIIHDGRAGHRAPITSGGNDR